MYMKRILSIVCLVLLPLWVLAGVEGTFLIKNEDGNYLRLQTQYTETNAVNATPMDADEGTLFTLAGSDAAGYSICDQDGNYMIVSTTIFWNTSTSTTASSPWTIEEAGDGLYYIRNTQGYLKSQGDYAYTNGGLSDNVRWQLEVPAPPKSTLVTAVSQLTSGSYYRFVNVGNAQKALNETDGKKLDGANVSETAPSQVWKLVKNGTKWKLKNLLTDNYIGSSSNTSVQSTYPTNSTGSSFTIGSLSDGVFYVSEGTVPNSGLNYNTAYNVVVNWQYQSDKGSQWNIYKVENVDELTTTASDYREAGKVSDTKLSTYFVDKACTQLRSNYAAMTDDDLRTAMSTLPAAVREMAVKVKNQQWNPDATYSKYEQMFRISDYEIYTNCNWNKIMGVGPFAMLYNPTGITVKAGDVVYVFADQGAKDSDAELLLHVACVTDRYSSQTLTLHEGVNVLLASCDGEIMIDYTLNNAPDGEWNGKTVGQYDPIKVHIEGGTCTGTWDLHRGMTNQDWAWLRDNMFKSRYLHVKGHSTMLNVQTKDVIPESDPTTVMKVWDFVFDTEESLLGADAYRKTGAYKPMINSRNSFQGNPNWDGGHGTNHPGLSYQSGEFNSQELVHTGQNGGAMWVIEHEEGHAHQYPVNLAGMTESSNNGLAQMVNHLWGYRTSRGKGVYDAQKLFNEGYTWVDYMRGANHRRTSIYDQSLWMTNRMFFQLWLYFDYLGYYQPEGGERNDGFAFFSRLARLMREKGGIRTGNRKEAPGSYKTDYMLFAEVAAEAAQTDLTDFFEMWGIFRYADEVKLTSLPSNGDETVDESVNDDPDNGIYFIGDYGNYYIQMPVRTNAADVEYVNGVRARMKAYPNKAPGLLFINDMAEQIVIRDDAKVLEFDPSVKGQKVQYYYSNVAGTQGKLGMFTSFATDNLNTKFQGNVTKSTGKVNVKNTSDGLVGFKVYDEQGQLCYVSTDYTFTVGTEMATKIVEGAYRLVAVSGTGYELDYRDWAAPVYEEPTIGQLARKIARQRKGESGITLEYLNMLVDRMLRK